MVGISVVIPVYNVERYIAGCLNSVFAQSFTDFEIVIVNDGSKDNSKEIIAQFQEKYGEKIVYLEKENGGLSSARNMALEHVNGKYITFLDSDDYLATDYLGLLYTTAEQNHCDVVCSGQNKVREDGEIISKIRYQVTDGKCLTRRLNISGKLYRTEYVKKQGILFPLGKTYEDNPFNLVMLFMTKNIIFLEYEGYNQIVHEGSITSQKIDINKLPFAALEKSIKHNLTNGEELNDRELFEFTVLSFFTYFLFVRNKKKEYLTASDKNSDIVTVMQICEHFQRFVQEYFPKCYKNKYARIFKGGDLVFVQRIGVKVFAYLCKFNLLKTFTMIFYKI